MTAFFYGSNVPLYLALQLYYGCNTMTQTSLRRDVCAWCYTWRTSNYNIHLGEYCRMKERKYEWKENTNGPLMWQNELVNPKPNVEVQFGCGTMLCTDDDEVFQHVRHVKLLYSKGCVS